MAVPTTRRTITSARHSAANGRFTVDSVRSTRVACVSVALEQARADCLDGHGSGRTRQLCPGTPDVELLRALGRVVDPATQAAVARLASIPCVGRSALLYPPQQGGGELERVEPEARNPFANESRVLPGLKTGHGLATTSRQEPVGPATGLSEAGVSSR